MSAFPYVNDILHAESISVAEIAKAHGTPCFIYSRAALEQNLLAYEEALQGVDHLTCFAVKANSNLAVLSVLARKGAGFDIVSGGELERVIRAGGDPKKVIFSGLGKTEEEIASALEHGIRCFNIESEPELERINSVAERLNMRAPISLRVNPDVDAGTHPYISTGLKENKFGIAIETAPEVYLRAAQMPHIEIVGVDCHIGSQLTTIAPYLDAIDRLLLLVDELGSQGIAIRHFDIGGGLGVSYRDETPPATGDFIKAILAKIEGRGLSLFLEPGRSICADAGIFVTKVEYLKHNSHKNFAIVDGAMNDLLRPALYGAWQNIIPVNNSEREEQINAEYDIVGPVCESGDFLGKDRALGLVQGDLLAVCTAGAYGFVMSSNYNTRNRAAEIMVDGDKATVVRQRETLDYQLALETVL